MGLLDLEAMAMREIDVITEGDVVAFHGQPIVERLRRVRAGQRLRRVKGYDIESQGGLVVPQLERNSAIRVAFENRGSRPHEVVLRVTDVYGNESRTETVTLIPHR